MSSPSRKRRLAACALKAGSEMFRVEGIKVLRMKSLKSAAHIDSPHERGRSLHQGQFELL
jgi:hypothetical protein